MTTPISTLGAFSISLSVADLTASKEFYATLGFEVVGGNADQNWLILRNGLVTIGLFHGMFERNMLTFNPGWDATCQTLDEFTDVREHQKRVEAAGITMQTRVDEDSKGPGSFVITDPDGNPILVDQHV